MHECLSHIERNDRDEEEMAREQKAHEGCSTGKTVSLSEHENTGGADEHKGGNKKSAQFWRIQERSGCAPFKERCAMEANQAYSLICEPKCDGTYCGPCGEVYK